MTRHTLSVLVENKSGVLARVSALFSRRGFNIESLAVGPTENPDLSRMTIVVDAESQPLEQITKQLNKLIEVIKIVELDSAAAVQRELLLVKVRAPMADRTQGRQTPELARAAGGARTRPPPASGGCCSSRSAHRWPTARRCCRPPSCSGPTSWTSTPTP